MDVDDAQFLPIEPILVIHADQSLGFIWKSSTLAVSIHSHEYWLNENYQIFQNKLIKQFNFFSWKSVPRKVLKDQFDASVEPDEPQQIDMDPNQDDLYDEDQFYRESEAIPPAPKLHRELATSDMPTSLSEPSSSVNPPLRSRDSNQLEGEFSRVFHDSQSEIDVAKCVFIQSKESALGLLMSWIIDIVNNNNGSLTLY